MVMVVVMVGLNYNLKERTKREGQRGRNREGEGREVIRPSEVSFAEGRGTFSNVVVEDNLPKKNIVNV